MGKPCCLQHNHLIIVIYLGAFWIGSETHFSPCCVVWGSLSREETLMVLVATCKMGWRCTEGSSSWPGVGGRSRKTEPCAWWWLGSGDGVGRWRQGLVSVGSLEGQGQSGAASSACFPLCQIWSACPQDPVKGCGAARQSWGARGTALEMGLVEMSASGSAVTVQH